LFFCWIQTVSVRLHLISIHIMPYPNV
jgi:hypothetical protein